MTAPIALTCGEPAGIGPEIAVKARHILGADLPFFWMGDARHLPPGTAHRLIASPAEAIAVPPGLLPVLPHPFAAPATPGQTDKLPLHLSQDSKTSLVQQHPGITKRR